MEDRCLVRDPAPGARLEERECDKTGARTLHEWVWIPHDPLLGGAPGWWDRVCLGQPAADFAAGK